MVNDVRDDELIDRLTLNEPAQEITVSREDFDREWLSLKDCTNLFNVSTKKAVYDIIKRENLSSKVFMVGKKPVRYVGRSSIQGYLAKRHSDTNVVDVRYNDPNVTNKLLTQEVGNMLVSVRDLPNQVRDLTEAMRNINTQMLNIVEKVVDQGIDLKEKWLQDRERRADIDMKQLAIQEQQLKAQQDLLARITDQARVSRPQSTAFIISVSAVLIVALTYFGYRYFETQTNAFVLEISQKDTKFNKTLTAFQNSLNERETEIAQLKTKVQELETRTK